MLMVNDEGENSIVVAPCANGNLLPKDIEKIKNIAEAAIILMQLEIPIETIIAVLQIAKKNNQPVIINPAPAHQLDDALLDGLFLITPNESETSLMTGIKVEDDKTASQAAKVFLEKGVQNVVITLGRLGAYFENENVKFTMRAPVVKAIDTTAAGDTFSGALAVALTENTDSQNIGWKNAIKFAVDSASISVTRLGAQASVPYRSEIVI